MPHVHDVGVATGAAGGTHEVLLDLDHCLGVLALLAKDELLDEAVQHVLELTLVMTTIDNVALSLKKISLILKLNESPSVSVSKCLWLLIILSLRFSISAYAFFEQLEYNIWI